MKAVALERRPGAAPEPLWLEWAALLGLLLFAVWLLGARGVFTLLLSSDPTGITAVIMIVFAGSTLWCGARSRQLERCRGEWAAEYREALAAAPRDADAPLDLLTEHTHGPHTTAWWVNGILLKLGLLGKVIGFSMLALQIGHTQSFDASQSQELLKSLTTGLGVALLTTMVGLVGNILLGLQLTRLDRFADAIVTQAQRSAIEAGR